MNLKIKLLCGIAALLTGAMVAQAQVPGVNSTLNSVFTLVYDQSTMKPTYSATSGMFTVASAATDVCSVAGSATKTVKVRRVSISAVATAVVTEPVELIKRSAVVSGGTQTADPVTTYDSINVASTVLAEHFTGNPTVGASVGPIAFNFIGFANFTTGLGTQFIFELGQRGQPVVLRGVAQSLTVNLLGITPSGAQMNCTFEWTEE